MNPAVMVVRSSLEEMLESLRQRDEEPKDVPPALPSRPSSRGRLPSARRSLPVNFKVENAVSGTVLFNQEKEKADKVAVLNSGILGKKKLAEVGQEGSPFVKLPALENYEERSKENDVFQILGEFNENLRFRKSTSFVLKEDLHVWCQLPNATGWDMGFVQSLSGQHARILLSGGKISTVHVECLLPANPDIFDGTDDLIKLSYLHEPSVLHNLKCRYTDDIIYTKAGPILVAINPLRNLDLHGSNFEAYRHKTIDAPHVYSVADAAFSEMMKEGINQSVIISGESGAGKTETAKMAMQYLAALGGDSGIEHKILRSNLILEAFGNAKTLRNDNSSRFGKLVEMQFSATGRIYGAKMRTFLLEKLRVIKPPKGERSYHVFYQLCAGAPLAFKDKFNLKPAHEYEYLKQSGFFSISEVDDAHMFHILMEALDIVQICKKDQEDAFAVLAAVLWLGNVKFELTDIGKHAQVIPGEALISAAKLMGCEVDELVLALSTRTILIGNDCIAQRLALQEAIDTRDALAKSIYSSLFEWLVEQINISLKPRKRCTGRCISVLDIYGFESFHNNSFEQFCINYTSERLQQHFNRHLFKLVQEEFIQDGIDWMNADFIDNIDCLNLFEKKPMGILSLLDEESKRPEATDLTLATKLRKHLSSNPCFKGEMNGAFKIRHYAGEVLYDTTGFLEKNRDPLYSDSIQILQSCNCQLLQSFASRMLNQSQRLVKSRELIVADFQKHSVGTKFKAQMFRLMQHLESTTPHFIRCIKPNSKQLSDSFEDEVVLEQLRCSEILQVVRMSSSSYPTRITHQQFAERYGFLLFDDVDFEDPLCVSFSILHQFNIPPEMYQVGYTKLFLRSGQISVLENARKSTIERIVWVQKQYRSLQARRHFQVLKQAAIFLQSFIRGYLARKKFLNLRNNGRERLFNEKTNGDKHKGLQERKDISEKPSLVQASSLTELERRVLQAEAMLRQKEDECAALREKLQLSDMRWLEHNAKMKSKEEMWQKHLSSLQLSLDASKTSQPSRRPDLSALHHNHINHDSENVISTEPHTPDGTPPRRHPISTISPARDFAGKNNRVGILDRDFEQRVQVFEGDARLIGQLNPYEELQQLKVRFYAWKKDFKARLREAKVSLRKSGVSEGEKIRRRWWVKRAIKI